MGSSNTLWRKMRIAGIVLAASSAVAHMLVSHAATGGSIYNACHPFSFCSERDVCREILAAAMATALSTFAGLSLLLAGVCAGRSVDGRRTFWALFSGLETIVSGASIVLIRYLDQSFLGACSRDASWSVAAFFLGGAAILLGVRVFLLGLLFFADALRSSTRVRFCIWFSAYAVWSLSFSLWLFVAVFLEY